MRAFLRSELPRCLAITVGLMTVAGCEVSGLASGWRRLDPPVAAPDFTIAQLDGTPITLSKFRGQVVIIDFWATWCGPCRFSLPSLEVISKRYHDHGVTVLLINEGETTSAVRRWAQRRFTTPILLDQDEHVGQLYHVQGLPTSLVVNQSGQIVYTHEGYGGGLERSLDAILQELLPHQPPST